MNNLVIKRTVSVKSVSFSYSDSNKIIGTYNYTGGFLLRKLTVHNQSESTYVMQQKSLLRKMIMNLFMLVYNPSTYPNFQIYYKGDLIGNSKHKFFNDKNEVLINNDIYAIYIHSNNYVSIHKNDVQIALLQRNDRVICGEVDYRVICERSLCDDRELLLLFTMFIDISYWYTPLKIDFYKIEKTTGKERHPEMISWRPSQFD